MTTRPPGTPDVDLTYDGAFGTINGAVFQTPEVQPAGSGTFNTFVRIQHTGTEQGYNSDTAPQFDEKSTFDHSILLANIPIVVGDGSGGTEEGVAYREFRLDLNETTAGGFISLDALQIWQEEAGNLTNFTAGSGFAGTHTNALVYNLDAGGNHWVGLNNNLSHGSGQSDVRILIPDSAFLNDAAHRYVTVYSQFGLQSGWNSDSGYEEWSINNDHTGPTAAMAVHKTATVPGDTANVVGEVISYAIKVDNVGDTALTGITLTDPSVSNLAAVLSSGFNVGDTNHDNKLSAGETWSYTASHIVTQTDLNTGGNGTGAITNTVTADSAETAPVSATAFVLVESGAGMELTKTANVTSVDSAGDVITYDLALTNTGNIQLSGLQLDDSNVNILIAEVTDPDAPVPGAELLAQVLNGDYNVGDVGTLAHPEFAQNGVQDPGETFVFVNAGDTNQNGIQDVGETFLFTNIGDTNQNGFQDGLEVFQYYNAGDTNHNDVEDAGETFQFTFNHSATPVLSGGFNAGDTNSNGLLDPGETWQYTVSYTVTQSEIDNGGVVDPLLTHDNTATADTDQDIMATATASVDIIQDPRVTLTKTATVADGTADAANDVINYTIDVANAGNMTLTGAVVSDSPADGLAAVESGGFNTGDTNTDGKLSVGETWHYTDSHTVTQAEIDNGGVVNPGLAYNNTASVTTDQGTQNPGGDPDANDTDSASVHIVQNPHLSISKAASVPGGTADHAGEVISYTITVANDGNMTLTNPMVSDPSVSNLALASGDTNSNGKIDVGETWHYTASHTVTQDDIDNHPPTMSGPGTIHNAASIATHEGASGSASADVTVGYNPALTITKAATVPGGTATLGEVISYTIDVHNTGNVTLTTPMVSDPSVGNLAYSSGDLDNDGKIDVGETWQYTASHTVTQSDIDSNPPTMSGAGMIDNTASVTTSQGASGSASAHVPVDYNPAVDLTKSADVPGGTADTAGEVISWKIDVANTGNVTLTGVSVSDPSVSDLAAVMSGVFNSGDINQDGSLNLGETWHYTASHTVTQTEIDTNGGGDGTIDNTASVTTTQGASDSASASVTVVQPPPPLTYTMTLEKSAFGYLDNNNDDIADTGDTLVYHFSVHNTGTGTLTDVQVTDPDGFVTMTGGILASLAGGATDSTTWSGTYTINSLDVSNGYHDNEGVANSLEANAVSGTIHTILSSLNEII